MDSVIKNIFFPKLEALIIEAWKEAEGKGERLSDHSSFDPNEYIKFVENQRKFGATESWINSKTASRFQEIMRKRGHHSSIIKLLKWLSFD